MSPPPEATARFLRRWPLRPVVSVPEPALLFEPFGRPRFFPPSISLETIAFERRRARAPRRRRRARSASRPVRRDRIRAEESR